MDDYVKPLVEEYERLDQQLKRAEAETARLREQRNRLRAVVKALAPEALAEKPKSKPKPIVVSEESVTLVRAVVPAVNGDQFTANDLLGRYGQRLPSDGVVKRALRVMHENGELRLVKTGRGGQKTYEVIR